MTFDSKEKFLDWIKLTKLVDIEYDSYDSCGNRDVCEIREFEGKFYKLEKMNGSYYHDYKNVGKYTPREVKKISRMVERITWEGIEE